jgi:DNA-binding MarR family transcriptional regulator
VEVVVIESDERFSLLINKLAHAMAVDMDRRLRVHDVTMSQWTVLKQLWKQEGRSQVELQQLLDLEAATVTGLVQRMTRGGLIRTSTDRHDKRVQRVFLTERGRELEVEIAPLEEDADAGALAGFSPDERAFFLRLVARAYDNTQR